MMHDDPRVDEHQRAIQAYGYTRHQLGKALAGQDIEAVQRWEKARGRAWDEVVRTMGNLYYRDK